MTWNGMAVASPAAWQVNVTGFTSRLLQQSTFCDETNDTCCPCPQLEPSDATQDWGSWTDGKPFLSPWGLHIWFCIFSDTLSRKGLTTILFFFSNNAPPSGIGWTFVNWGFASKKSQVSIWMVFKSRLALVSARACPVHQASSFVTQWGDQRGVAPRPIPHFHKLNELLKAGSFTAQCFLSSAKKSKRMQ